MQPLSAKSSWNIPGASWLGLGEKSKTSSGNGKAKEEDETEGIYSPRIRLTYTPPTPLPAPFPETLHAEGLHLYIASSIFLRHTLNALNTDLRVELRHIRVHGGQESGECLTTGTIFEVADIGSRFITTRDAACPPSYTIQPSFQRQECIRRTGRDRHRTRQRRACRVASVSCYHPFAPDAALTWISRSQQLHIRLFTRNRAHCAPHRKLHRAGTASGTVRDARQIWSAERKRRGRGRGRRVALTDRISS